MELSKAEAADFLATTPQSLDAWRRKGAPGFLLDDGGRVRAVDVDALVRWRMELDDLTDRDKDSQRVLRVLLANFSNRLLNALPGVIAMAEDRGVDQEAARRTLSFAALAILAEFGAELDLRNPRLEVPEELCPPPDQLLL